MPRDQTPLVRDHSLGQSINEPSGVLDASATIDSRNTTGWWSRDCNTRRQEQDACDEDVGISARAEASKPFWSSVHPFSVFHASSWAWDLYLGNPFFLQEYEGICTHIILTLHMWKLRLQE